MLFRLLLGIFIKCRGIEVYVFNVEIGVIPSSALHRPEEEKALMSHPIRNMVILSATALALIAAPVLMNQTVLSDLQAVAKDKGNGNGNGAGNSDGGGSGHGGGSSNSNAGGHSGGGDSNGQSNESEAKGKKVADTEAVTTTGKSTKIAKTKNLSAQLAGLNSLKRNINGLMNSSDPRMLQIRAFVEASAALETATVALESAEATLTALQGKLDAYVADYVTTAALVAYDGTYSYADATLQSLNDRLAALALVDDPANAEAIAAEQSALMAVLAEINLSPELAAVTEQQGIVQGIEGEIAVLEPQTTEDVLQAALLAAANKNRVAEAGGDAYLTPEIMAWASGVLGVGDKYGLIDDLLAQQ